MGSVALLLFVAEILLAVMITDPCLVASQLPYSLIKWIDLGKSFKLSYYGISSKGLKYGHTHLF